MFVEPAEPTFEQNRGETKPTLHLAPAESPFSRKIPNFHLRHRYFGGLTLNLNLFIYLEMTNADKLNEAWDRTIAADVKYRFVIDAESFQK